MTVVLVRERRLLHYWMEAIFLEESPSPIGTFPYSCLHNINPDGRDSENTLLGMLL